MRCVYLWVSVFHPLSTTLLVKKSGHVHTPFHMITSYIQAGTYAQSRSLTWHQSWCSVLPFSFMSISVSARDTNNVVIRCCQRRKRAGGDLREEISTYTCLHVYIWMPSSNSPNLNHSTLQSTAEQSGQSHNLSQLVARLHIQHTRSTLHCITPTANNKLLCVYPSRPLQVCFGL